MVWCQQLTRAIIPRGRHNAVGVPLGRHHQPPVNHMEDKPKASNKIQSDTERRNMAVFNKLLKSYSPHGAQKARRCPT